jgi:hypothetical protein
MNNLNELIVINLNLLAKQNRMLLHRDDFIDEENKSLHLSMNTGMFADILFEKGLVTFDEHGNYFNYITEKGIQIVNSGGWINHIKKKIEFEIIENTKKEQKELLETEKNTVDLELAKKMLKEFPKTKFFALSGFIISVITIILALLQMFGVLK